MFIPRIIPCLPLRGNGLVKTVKFKDEKYIGDIINAVKIFNEKEVDELIILDINATIENKLPRLELIKDIASECFMPLCYGGGISKLAEIEQIFKAGVEKISLNTSAMQQPQLITEASNVFGSQSIVASVDIKKSILGNYKVYSHRSRKSYDHHVVEYVRQLEKLGVGEIFLNSVDRDGVRRGYDLDLVKLISQAIDIPLIACGGAGAISDFKEVFDAGASAAAAGSFFVLHGKHLAVLITYPKFSEIEQLFSLKEESANDDT